MAAGCRCVSSADISDFSPAAPSPRPVPGASGGLWASVQPLPGRPPSPACASHPHPGPQAALPPLPRDSFVPAAFRSLHPGGLRVYAQVALRSEQHWPGCLFLPRLPTGPRRQRGQNPGVEWAGMERGCEGEAGASGRARLHLAGGRWRTPVSPACVPGLLALCRMEGKQLDSEVPQDTWRLPGGTAALSSRPAAWHCHPGSGPLVASLPEASPLSETFCIPLGLLKISF